MACHRSILMAAFGNPLLDLLVTTKNTILLSRYNLQPDGQKEVTENELKSIICDIEMENYSIEYCPGGCAQNMLRVFQWISRKSFCSVMCGGIGDDDLGRRLKEMVNLDGVETRFAVTQSQSSGTCISFINGQQRSLVAHIGAANTYTIDDLLKNKDVFDEVSIIYFEGFFLTHSFKVVVEIVAQCQIRGILLVYNISGVYVVQQYQEAVRLMAGAANIIIGNRLEVEELVKVLNLVNPVQLDSPCLLQSMPFQGKTAKQLKLKNLQFAKDKRLVVMTDGKNTVVCVDGAGRTEHAVPAMDACSVRDTTGAGDAFTAGFLFGLVRGKNVDTSLDLGVWAAQQIIRQVGCTLPSVVPEMPCYLCR